MVNYVIIRRNYADMRRSRGSDRTRRASYSVEDLRDYVMQVIDATAENIRRCCRISARCATPKSTISMVSLTPRPRAWDCRTGKHPPVEMVKRKESEYERIGTGLPRPGSEETEAVTTIDLLVRGGIKSPLPASPAMVTWRLPARAAEAADGCAAGRSG